MADSDRGPCDHHRRDFGRRRAASPHSRGRVTPIAARTPCVRVAIQVTQAAHEPLATTIDALIRSKATGKLAVTSSGQSASLYFLFGHLYHAESGGLKGEDAVEVALAWLHPSTMFDPQAHLPSQETILRPPA